MDQPMKRVITSPQLSGRLTTWAIEMSKFDISYVPHTRINAQALVNFVIEFTTKTPANVIMEYALRFTFPTTNNQAGYQTMVTGLAIVKYFGIRHIWVKGDSKLIIDQVKGVRRIKNEPLVKYHARAIQLARGFEQILFEHIRHAPNEEADHLS
ncbi:hypothetical protein LIER_33317 [Lithospermum erythrorhizon]|uniref:RNase H type-1 domain-containing protein n=1 Tax=Lithospermum erythrorhizon TaxID=34254 RepID=A0AAV3RYK1_LITER